MHERDSAGSAGARERSRACFTSERPRRGNGCARRRSGEQGFALTKVHANLDALGFAGVMRYGGHVVQRPHGCGLARVHTWDGDAWKITWGWYQADAKVIDPLVREAAATYASSHHIEPRATADCKA